MTAYSWLLKQIVTEQTDLVKNLLANANIRDASKHMNIFSIRVKSSGFIFKNENEYKLALQKASSEIKKLEEDLTNLLQVKLKANNITYQSEFRTELIAKTKEIEDAEKRLVDLKDIEEFQTYNCGWYLIQNATLLSILAGLEFPAFVFSNQCWWGVPEPIPSCQEFAITQLKSITIIQNAKDEDIINYIDKKLVDHLGASLEHKDEVNVIPFWRREFNDFDIFADTRRNWGYNSSNSQPLLTHHKTEPSDPLEDFRSKTSDSPIFGKLDDVED